MSRLGFRSVLAWFCDVAGFSLRFSARIALESKFDPAGFVGVAALALVLG